VAATSRLEPTLFPSASVAARAGNDNPRRVAHPTAALPSDRHTTVLAVENMHCGGCLRKVEAALTGLDGVLAARVDLSQRRVRVEHDAAHANEEALVAALAGKGFSARVLLDALAPSDHAREQRDLLRRLAVAGFAAANVMLLSVAVWAGIASDMEASLQTLFHWLSAAIALPAVAYAGQPFFRSARTALAAGRLNMDVPISLGVTLATAMSLYQTVRGSEQVYFDAAITLLFFLLVGRTLDQGLRAKARSAAENLTGLASPSASLVEPDGSVLRVPTRTLVPGQRLLVAAGERLPVDGQLASPVSEIDESLLTGESRPRTRLEGERLVAGSVNLAGPIEIVATAREEDATLAELARLIGAAEQAKGTYVRLADRAARFYAPAVHILGLATFLGWMVLGHGWEPALTAAIAVLIITCPCALALAVPAVQVAAVGRLFSRGIIVKAADGLERLAEVDTVVLDKTGTLTHGEPRLADPGAVDDATLELAASLGVASRHPYARAVVRAAHERGLAVVRAEGVEETPGAGLSARLADGRQVRLGSASFTGVGGAVHGRDGDGAALWLRLDDAPPRPLPFTDALRADAARTVTRLGRLGLASELLSGDRAEIVEAAAAEAGLQTWRSGQYPEDKIARLRALSAAGHKVLMVGDGLNDAPALAAGHASLSPSTASDVAQTAADVVFQGERLAPVAEAVSVARAARRLALQNFAIAVGYNIIFVPMAVMGHVTPLIAAIAMSASSIAVTLNALRLRLSKVEVSP
jgi:Cu2+-exporting ATPase